MREAYIVSSVRTAVGKAKRGSLAQATPVEMGAVALQGAVDKVANLNLNDVDDIIVGCAAPEAEQGMNVAQLIGQRAGRIDEITGMTINRMCSSGLQSIALAHQAIAFGQSEVMAAGGTESMTMIAMGGNHFMPDPALMTEAPTAYMTMGNTAEQVVKKYNVSREAMDQFALDSHTKALAAIADGKFVDEIIPMTVKQAMYNGREVVHREFEFKVDEGPREGSTLESLGKLRPVFNPRGQVTAATSSQMSDGAAMTILMSENKVNELSVKPIAKLLGFVVAPVPASLMGIGPVNAIPKALKLTGLELSDIGLFELNEAFASQSIAVINELGLNKDIVNVNGGALALGHPLGCTGAKLTSTLLHEMQRRSVKYGICTMCVGGGMGAAGVFENLLL